MLQRRRFAGALATLAVGGLLAAAQAQAPAMPADGSPRDPAAMQARMSAHVQHRLDELAQELNLGGGQQAAWKSFSAATLDLYSVPTSPPAADADAATLARFAADQMALRAQKMSKVADALAALQQTATPQQKAILQHEVRRRMHPGGMHHGMHPGPGTP